MKKNDYILIQEKNDNNIFFGADKTYNLKSINNTNYTINDIITFKKIFINNNDDLNSKFQDYFHNTCEKRKMLREKIANNWELEARVRDTSKRVILRPVHDTKEYEDLVFILPKHYIKEYELPSALEVDDILKIKCISFSKNIILCKITDIIYKNNQLVKQYEYENKLNTLVEDLKTMSGKALWSPKVYNIKDIVTSYGETIKCVEIAVNDIIFQRTINIKLLPYIPKIGEYLSVWIWPYKNERKQPSFNGLKTHVVVEKKFPDYKVQYSGKNGIVTSYMPKEYILLTATFDQYTWSNFVFRNKYYYKTRSWGVDTMIETMLRKILMFLPLGFEARFITDFKYSEKTDNPSRLRLCGFSTDLEGRVCYISEINSKERILRQHVLGSISGPYTEEDYYIFVSADYSGVIYKNDMHPVLLDYAKQYIFTPELKVPAVVMIEKLPSDKKRTESRRIVFDVNTALKKNLSSIKNMIGEIISLKLCSISGRKIYLTTDCGYPVLYKCLSETELSYMRNNMFRKCKFFLKEIIDDNIIVTNYEFAIQKIDNLKLNPGAIIVLDNIINKKNGFLMFMYMDIYFKVYCQTLEEEDFDSQQIQAMIISLNKTDNILMCVGHPESFQAPQNTTKVTLLSELDNNLWLCYKKNKRMLMRTSDAESTLLRFIGKLYEKPVVIVVSPIIQENNFYVKFEGTIEEFDYSNLLDNAIKLTNGISRKTPTVLYGDLMLTIPSDLLSEKPVTNVKFIGEAIDNRMLCLEWTEDLDYDNIIDNDIINNTDKKTLSGTVKSVSDESKEVTFEIEQSTVVLKTDEQLHIPLKLIDSLSEIFPTESKWAIVNTNDKFELDNNCPNYPMPYILVQQLKWQKRPNKEKDWIVKSYDGKIGLLDGKSQTSTSKGEYIFLTLDEGACLNDNYTFLRKSDISIKGKKMEMMFDSFDNENMLIRCHPVDLNLKYTFCIPKTDWNWVSKHMNMNMDYYIGSTFVAEVSCENDDIIMLNRKKMLEQKKLFSDENIEGRYQMKVVDITDKGYLLRHSQVKAFLPFKHAAWFNLKYNYLNFDYLPVGTLVEVEITGRNDTTILANLKNIKKEEAEKWIKDNNTDNDIPFTICRIGKENIFLEKSGIVLPLSSIQLKEWRGTDLSSKYNLGQQFYDYSINWDNEKEFFSLNINIEKEITLPTINKEYDAVISRYINKNTNSCYVEFGEWAALVPFNELTWEPQPIGKRPYPEGFMLKVKILEIKRDNLLIIGSVKQCTQRPFTGPASEYPTEFVNLQKFKMTGYNNGFNEIYLANEDNVPGILRKEDCVSEVESIIKNIEVNNGSILLPVVGLYQFKLKCSQKFIYDELNEMKKQFEDISSKGELFFIDGKIENITNTRLFISYRTTTGTITKEEGWWQRRGNLKNIYKIGTTVKCVITEVIPDEFVFYASIIKADPKGYAKLLPFKEEGDNITVKVIRYIKDKKYVSVNIAEHILGVIPESEIQTKNVELWSERFKDDWINVKVIKIDWETLEFTLSRKQVLAPGIIE